MHVDLSRSLKSLKNPVVDEAYPGSWAYVSRRFALSGATDVSQVTLLCLSHCTAFRAGRAGALALNAEASMIFGTERKFQFLPSTFRLLMLIETLL